MASCCSVCSLSPERAAESEPTRQTRLASTAEIDDSVRRMLDLLGGSRASSVLDHLLGRIGVGDPESARGDRASVRLDQLLGKIGLGRAANWVRQAERDRGLRAGPTTEERDRIKALEREVRELRQANEILRKASAYFAQAELDRRFKP